MTARCCRARLKKMGELSSFDAPSVTAQALVALARMVQERRAALSRHVCISFTVVDEEEFVLDTAASPLLRRGMEAAADVHVICNEQGLIDFLRGELGNQQKDPTRIFTCDGEREAFLALARCLESTMSLLDFRVDQAS